LGVKIEEQRVALEIHQHTLIATEEDSRRRNDIERKPRMPLVHPVKPAAACNRTDKNKKEARGLPFVYQTRGWTLVAEAEVHANARTKAARRASACRDNVVTSRHIELRVAAAKSKLDSHARSKVEIG